MKDKYTGIVKKRFVFYVMASKHNTIKEHLDKQERSVNWLSKRSGISRVTLGKYIRGETEPTIVRLKIIASILSVTPCDLIKEEDPVNRI